MRKRQNLPSIHPTSSATTSLDGYFLGFIRPAPWANFLFSRAEIVFGKPIFQIQDFHATSIFRPKRPFMRLLFVRNSIEFAILRRRGRESYSILSETRL